MKHHSDTRALSLNSIGHIFLLCLHCLEHAWVLLNSSLSHTHTHICITWAYNHLQELWCDITLFINYTVSQQTGPPSERSHIITIITIMSHYDHFHHATVWLYKFPLVCVSMHVCVSVYVCEFSVCVCVCLNQQGTDVDIQMFSFQYQ